MERADGGLCRAEDVAEERHGDDDDDDDVNAIEAVGLLSGQLSW